ncbi:hypothetical protein WA026_017674 [Henosepilachna vigintioctopunctata]|uniref:Uncharacterized protein n=1 Tax=Henosepilachna vigintioctopunctata TaxID=420089 RepID=A0AAW1U9C7_9CUCU
MDTTKQRKGITVQRSSVSAVSVGSGSSRAGSTRSSSIDCKITPASCQAGGSGKSTGENVRAKNSPVKRIPTKEPELAESNTSDQPEQPEDFSISPAEIMCNSGTIREEIENCLFNQNNKFTKSSIETIPGLFQKSEKLLMNAQLKIAHLEGQLAERPINTSRQDSSSQRTYASVATTVTTPPVHAPARSAKRKPKANPLRVTVSSSASSDAEVVKTEIISKLRNLPYVRIQRVHKRNSGSVLLEVPSAADVALVKEAFKGSDHLK